MRFLVLTLLALTIMSCNDGKSNAPQQNKVPQPAQTTDNKEEFNDFELISTFSIDESAFVQGLICIDNFLYVGTGLNEHSTIHKINLDTKEEVKKINVPDYFCEGITKLKDKLYQLTWKEEVCIVYNFNTLEKIKEFDYKGEGWGLTTDGKQLIMSDGSNTIKFINPDNFSTIKEIKIFNEKGFPQYNLNELEYANGYLYSNIWTEDKIVKINLETGVIEQTYDLNQLRFKLNNKPNAEVLNGIAYNPKSGTFYVTGKLWGTVYEIKFKK